MNDLSEALYEQLGIDKDVYELGEMWCEKLKERFDAIDGIAEYNQLKVIKGMQEAKVSEACLTGTKAMVIMIWEEKP